LTARSAFKAHLGQQFELGDRFSSRQNRLWSMSSCGGHLYRICAASALRMGETLSQEGQSGRVGSSDQPTVSGASGKRREQDPKLDRP
jgi:hypothetical protein